MSIHFNFPIFRTKKYLLIAYLVICLLVGIIIGFIANNYPQSNTARELKLTANNDTNSIIQKEIPTPPEDIDESLEYSTASVSANSKHLSMLFLGYGGAGHDGGYLSDAMILVYLDVVKKKLAMIHIPRDIWVNIKIGDKQMPLKINSALAMGTKTSNYPTTTVSKDTVLRASTLSKQAVTTVTGLPVDFVLGVDFNSFPAAIDSIGGIDLNLNSHFDDPWYPVKGRELELCGHTPEEVTAMSATMSGFALEKQFPCRYERLHFTQGKNHMDGQTALKYGRSRHTSSDFARGLRQIGIIRATVEKLFGLAALDKIPDFYQKINKTIKTDITIDQLKIIAPILALTPELEVIEIGLDTNNVLLSSKSNNGAFILIPKDGEDNWQGVQKYIQNKI